MPKSSTEIAIPMDDSLRRMELVSSASARKALSVISTARLAGERPVSESAANTAPTSRPRLNCRDETLTAMRKDASPYSRHARFWRQASRSTHSPIGSIRPLSSASEMNRSGGIMPNSGWFQRISDSAPTTAPERMSTTGW